MSNFSKDTIINNQKISHYIHKENIQTKCYLIECRLIRELKSLKGKMIYPTKRKINGIKYHKTKYGLIEETIIIEKIQTAGDNNLIKMIADFKKNNNIILTIEQLKTFSWGRKV